MDYTLYISVLVPLGIYLMLPRWLQRSGHKETRWRWSLIVACLLFFIAWYLPSPEIDGQDTSFVTHFVGGGMFCAFLWYYLEKSFRLKWQWYARFMALFALVSALGNINELFELFAVRTQFANILITDTSWDILANTAGALVTYGIILLVEMYDRRH